jgi:PAT family acetyl-CoA transporter-like MFS transporter 1
MEKGVSFKDLALLSFAFYPFSFKILFAPIEDIYYNSRIGKRKTYIIPL